MSSNYGQEYCEYLKGTSSSKWRRWINPQIPYAWNLSRLNLGFVLDIGCGVGRNLINLKGNGVGVEINPHCVEEAKKKGLKAYISQDFFSSEYFTKGRFDSLLLSHVVEHMSFNDAVDLIRPYLFCLKPGGRLVLITPQECGFQRDNTHIAFFGFDELKTLEKELGLKSESQYSFPFPRSFGSFFPHNEFVSVSRLASESPPT